MFNTILKPLSAGLVILSLVGCGGDKGTITSPDSNAVYSTSTSSTQVTISYSDIETADLKQEQLEKFKNESLKETAWLQLLVTIKFWMDGDCLNVRCEGIIYKGFDRYFDIKWEYSNKIANEKLRGKTGGSEHFIKLAGKGEWVAKTMDDAKKMAQDFNEGVS